MDPVRETPKSHECVCLLIKGPIPEPEMIKAVQEVAEAAGIPEHIIKRLVVSQDKCHRMVKSSDQPFCDSCERDGHHLLPNQMGMRNIVKEKSNDPATER